MTLGQYLTALVTYVETQFSAINKRLDEMQTFGMTDAEALAFGELKVQVATLQQTVQGVQASLQALVASSAEQSEKVSSVLLRLSAAESKLATMTLDWNALPAIGQGSLTLPEITK